MTRLFKPGDVVEGVFSGERLIVLPFTPAYSTEYSVALINGSYLSEMLEDELKATREKPYTIVKMDRKNDHYFDYTFFMFGKGRKRLLSAGCRWFTSLDEAKDHWSGKAGTYYGDTHLEPERIALNKTSLKIISRLNKRLTAKLEG